ncbi:carboxylesterase/lipase family protein [Pseudarthrobacter enclensis]|uniref:carboxylesterase/lipase family protein n=1 Tax=Pseudarthrobacter enclensis TaxID=993070 RepID=UPI00369C9773
MTLAFAPCGTFHGSTQDVDGATVHRFLGIAYAGSPAGDRRFRPPVPVSGHSGDMDATSHGPAAPQNPDAAAPPGDEPYRWSEAGCLNLNIWTPDLDGPPRPVMVWIHGGAYLMGANSDGMYDGARLAAATGTVVVAINYRLGALGFLHLAHLLGEGFEDSSNLALLDQLEALRWVRGNIEAFGGDPHQVTLFGESAGAAAIGTLLGMPASEGLFRRAIMQSGTAQRFRTPEASARVTAGFLRLCGLDESSASELLTMPVERLLRSQRQLEDHLAAGSFAIPLPFQPTAGTTSLPEPPLDSIRRGTNSGVDLIVGTNLNEGSFAVHLRPDRPGDPDYPHRAAAVLADGGLPEDRIPGYPDAVAEVLGRPPRGRELLEAAIADSVYRQPSNNLLDARPESDGGATGRTFAYLFTWPSPAMGGKLGSCHTLEIPFVFRRLLSPEAAYLTRGKAPGALGDAMSGAWAAFARTGSPDQPGLAWPDYGPDRRTLILDEVPRVEEDPRGAIRRLFTENRVRTLPAR